MNISLYFDEDSMDKALVRALQARRIDATTALEEDMIERDDKDHLSFAASQGRVLYSFNIGDFYSIHTTWLKKNKSHAGIVLSPQQQYSVGEQMRRLLKLISQVPAKQMKNRVEFLSNWGH